MMTARLKIVLLLTCMAGSLSACRRVECRDADVYLRLSTAFTDADLTYFVIERYEPGTNFSELASKRVYGTAVVGNTEDSARWRGDNDASFISVNGGRHDLRISMPYASRTYEIRDIRFRQEQERSGLFDGSSRGESCSNTLLYVLNGEEKSIRGEDEELRPVYIDLEK